jgi:hypothetical protein
MGDKLWHSSYNNVGRRVKCKVGGIWNDKRADLKEVYVWNMCSGSWGRGDFRMAHGFILLLRKCVNQGKMRGYTEFSLYQVDVFWVVTRCSVFTLPQRYTVSQPRRQWLDTIVLFIVHMVTNFLNTQLTNSMERNPSWETNSHSDSQEIHWLSWNLCP